MESSDVEDALRQADSNCGCRPYEANCHSPELKILAAELRRLRSEVAALRGVLETALHGLIICHNLDASDDAERLFRNPFVIDMGKEIEAVKAALASLPAAPEAK